MPYKPLPDLGRTRGAVRWPTSASTPRGRGSRAPVAFRPWDAWPCVGTVYNQPVVNNFAWPDLVVVLDFYPAATWLETLARAACPSEEMASVALAKTWCGLLKAEGGRGDAGGAARVGLRTAAVAGIAGAIGGRAGVVRQERVSDGVPGVPGGGLAHRQRGGGECVPDGGGPAAEGSGPALERTRGARVVPCAGPMPQRTRPMGGFLDAALPFWNNCSATIVTPTRLFRREPRRALALAGARGETGV